MSRKSTAQKPDDIQDDKTANGDERLRELDDATAKLEGTSMVDGAPPNAQPIQTTEIVPAVVTVPATQIELLGTRDIASDELPMQTAVVVGAIAEPVPAPRPQLDISKVAPRLYQGSAPTDLAYVGFTMIVLCAEEYQPELPAFQGKIVRAGFNDTPKPTPQDLDTAARASEEVFAELVRGGRVLVTCAAGLNRSALVVGMVLGRRLPANDVIAAIRHARGERALSNPTFRQIVEVCAVKTVSVQQRTRMGVSAASAAVPAKTKAAAPAQAASSSAPAPKRGILSMIFGTGLNRQRGEGRPKAAPGTGRGYYGRARAGRGAR